jgi:simple sugar transport system ATP-binding protein
VFLREARIRKAVAGLIGNFRIEPPAADIDIALLSGGNQQKVVAARELSRDPALLIASQPTRGLDIGAANMIRQLLLGQATAGKSVLLISADLAEIMSLSDRIGVMYRGGLVDIVDASGATEESLGLLMAGVKR